MCGLFGSVGLAPDPARLDLVAHRGPDGRGFGVFQSPAGPVALGHRRLAIIDTSDDALQPMADAAGRHHIVFNGEIYNYLELRGELEQRGEVFVTKSDTEVLLRAWMVWGPECLARLRGMFAFLLWDDRSKRLWAARDRFGIKPLYLCSSPASIAFGSEIKQLVGLPGVSGRMNIARVADFLTSGIIDHTAETMFEGVGQLRGGEVLEADCSRARPQLCVRRWYEVGAGRLSLPEDEAARRFRALLADAVRLHLRSDVPVGSCLSGGLDSSAIVGLMAGMLPPGMQVETVSACYGEKSVDEKPYMDAVVARTGARPHFVFPRPEDVLKRAAAITWHQDEPFGSTSIFAQWCVFEEARRAGIKVMLDGQGADEQLAGYYTAFPFHLATLLRRGRLIAATSIMLERRSRHGAGLAGQALALLQPLLPARGIALLRRRHRALLESDWLAGELLDAEAGAEPPIDVAVAHLGLERPRDVAGLCLAMTYASNLQMLLHWEDRNSMAHSIEARVPFLDHPLVEFSLALGNDHKVLGTETKRVLRVAMADVLPDAVRERRDKLGFATPEEQWFRGPLRGEIIDCVETTLRLFPGLLNAAGVRDHRDQMLSGRRRLTAWLWRIASLGIWGNTFKLST